MRSLAVSLSLSLTLACAAPLLAQRLSCAPAASPKELPAVSALLDSSSAVAELQAAKVLRDSMQFTLVLLPGDSIPAIAPFDSSDAMAAAVLARSVWPKQAAELWGVRVRVSGGAAPAVTVARATYCPPQLTLGSTPVPRVPELREQRGSVSSPVSQSSVATMARGTPSSVLIVPGVRGTEPLPTIFEITVSPLGKVSSVNLVRSSGSEVFDSVTERELAQQTYMPALMDGIPVPAVFRTDQGPSAPLYLSVGDVVLEGEVEQRPELLTSQALRYPAPLRQAGVEGRVIVRAILDTMGRAEPASVTIWQSTNRGFDQSARAFVLHARFLPARVHGHAVRVLVNLPIDFKLSRDEPVSRMQARPSRP